MGQLILSMPVTIAAGIAPKVRIRAHPPPAAPPFAASKPGSFGAGSTLQTRNASLDAALHLEPIVRLPSCCSPPKFGGHHDTCEDQFGERGGHHHHQLGGFGSRKSKQGPDHPA